MERVKIAEIIKNLRIERSWSQDLLAQNAGVSKRTIQRLEKEGHCSHETLLAVAGAFDIDVRQLTRFMNPHRVALQEMPSLQTREIEFSVPGALARWASKFPALNKRFYKNMATAGLAFLIIPLLFIVVNLLKYSFGFSSLVNPFDFLKSIPFLHQLITSPVFLFGSLVIALGLNVLPLINLNVKKEPEELTGSFSIKGNRWNAMIVGASLFFMTFMMGYAAVENISTSSTTPVEQAAHNVPKQFPVVQGSEVPPETATAEQLATEQALAMELDRIAQRAKLDEMARQAELDYLRAKQLSEVNKIYSRDGTLDRTVEPQPGAQLQPYFPDPVQGLPPGKADLVSNLKSTLNAQVNQQNISLRQLNSELRLFDVIASENPNNPDKIENLERLASTLLTQSTSDMLMLETLNFYEEIIMGDYQGEIQINGRKVVVSELDEANQVLLKNNELKRRFVMVKHQLAESIVQQRELLEWINLGDITNIDGEYLLNKLEAIKDIQEANLAQLKQMSNIVS